ncbi:uncharacterized protein LOC113005152 [Solenopsis invicta]|uniref:uncharacterized protein LOC113005152 n=1 Tax=Solenopsis invicta TaxID=13686 RepID=UPI000E33DAC1|nr:uncharacterized protein LOC113005152 [Solenopsis invicta]
MFLDVAVNQPIANNLINTSEVLTIYVSEFNEDNRVELNLNEMNVFHYENDNNENDLLVLNPSDNILSIDEKVQTNTETCSDVTEINNIESSKTLSADVGAKCQINSVQLCSDVLKETTNKIVFNLIIKEKNIEYEAL